MSQRKLRGVGVTGLMLGLLAALTAAPAHAQGECAAAQDFMVQAREKIAPPTGDSGIQDGLQLLKQANEMCPELGDAWYYRSLFENKLGHAPQAGYALRQARMLGSEAMSEGADPFAVAAPPRPGEKFSPSVHDKWALVVGIANFKNPAIPRLNFTTADATAFAAVLKDGRYGRFEPDHVRLLTDEEATTTGVKAALNWLARKAAEDDLVVVYISTHGTARDQDTAQVNYLITYDTDVSPHGHGVTARDSLYATALPMVEVAEVVRTRIKARKAAVFLDTCHSGGAIGNRPGEAPVDAFSASASMDGFQQGVGRVIIAASREKETSFESASIGHGYFTYYLIQALEQHNGLEPLSSVFDYLRAEVPPRVLADQKHEQIPVMSRSRVGGEIIIGINPAATPAATLKPPHDAPRLSGPA